MRKEHFLAVACLAIVLSGSLSRIAVADDDEEHERGIESDHSHEIEMLDERELEVEHGASSVAVKSQFQNQTLDNEYTITFSTEGGIRLGLDFSSESNLTKLELEAEVHFLELEEFIDRNGDGAPSAAERVQSVDLTGLTYSSPNMTSTTLQDGKSGYRFESHTLDEPFLFQIIAEIFPTRTIVNGTVVKPTETKITIVVKDYPYRENGSLALAMSAASGTDMEEDYHGTEKEVEVRSGNVEGYFSWSKDALVDGVVKEVKSNVASVDKGKMIVVSYPNGKDIVHDPKLGFSLLSVAAILPWLYMVVGASIIALAVAVTIRVFRPRIQGPMLQTALACRG